MTDVFENKTIRLKDAGKNELWLQNWICEKPERLGLGKLEVVEKELRQ